jgi:hypothetical protein
MLRMLVARFPEIVLFAIVESVLKERMPPVSWATFPLSVLRSMVKVLSPVTIMPPPRESYGAVVSAWLLAMVVRAIVTLPPST